MKPTNLTDHPEGGRFMEVFRSPLGVTTTDGAARCALTHIYFALKQGECSLFHRVESDEIWNLYQGEGVRLYTWDGTDAPCVCTVISAEENRFCHVVSSGVWQAAEPISGEVLVGCSVAPGFEFTDFQLLAQKSQEARKLLELEPQMAKLIKA